jgi:hypothetical protein
MNEATCQGENHHVWTPAYIGQRCRICAAPQAPRLPWQPEPTEGRVGIHYEASSSGGQLIAGNSPT